MKLTTVGMVLTAAALAGIGGGPAKAVFSGDMSPRAESSDVDYAAAIRARTDMKWEPMVASLQKVVARRPWHDNAHSLLGYGYRKLGDYDRALDHYSTALKLNPRHRQALAYLGMTYLHMGDLEQARTTLDRLGGVCRDVALTFSDGAFSDGCDEYRTLDEFITTYVETGVLLEDCPSEWH